MVCVREYPLLGKAFAAFDNASRPDFEIDAERPLGYKRRDPELPSPLQLLPYTLPPSLYSQPCSSGRRSLVTAYGTGHTSVIGPSPHSTHNGALCLGAGG